MPLPILNLPDEVMQEVVSHSSDCRSVVQFCKGVARNVNCGNHVWRDTARRLDATARKAFSEYTAQPQNATIWKVPPHGVMTRQSFEAKCKTATQRSQFLDALRRIRAWMRTDGWRQVDRKRVRIPISTVAFEFHNICRMNKSGIKVALRTTRDDAVELMYQREIPRMMDGERWGEWYPLHSDDVYVTTVGDDLRNAVEHFARSPHLDKGKPVWHGHARTLHVVCKPPRCKPRSR